MKSKIWLLLAGLLCTLPLQAKTWLIDVRTAQEYASEHASGAVNIEYQQILDGVVALGVKKSDELLLYCRSGRRAGLAQEALRQQGYQQVTNLGSLEQAKAAAGQAPEQTGK